MGFRDPLWAVRPEMADLAACQDGLVTLGQMRGFGISDWQIRKMIQRGWIHRAAPSVYAVSGSPPTHRRQLRLGLLTLGPESCVAYESAAALHHLDRSDLSAVEFLVPRASRNRHSPYTVHSSTRLNRLDVVNVEGLRATSATRTILDLALARHPHVRLEAAIDSAVRLGLSSPVVIAHRLRTLRGPGRWGCRTIDRLLEDSGGHSPLERKFLSLVRRAGLPRPRTQVIHRRDGKHVARVDFLFEDQNVVIEVTGRRGHSSPAERARDAQRRNELQDLGRKVYEFTWEQITRQEAWVRQHLLAYLTRAGLTRSRSARRNQPRSA